MTQLTDEQQERLLQQLIETPAGERIRMKCGAADLRSVITDLLSQLDRDSQAAGSPSHCALCEDPSFIYRDCVLAAATRIRDKCVDAIKSLRATPHGAAYNNAVIDAIHKCESLTLDELEPEKQK